MENRSEGDRLVAVDLGLPPIRWTGRRLVSRAEPAAGPQAFRSIDRAELGGILPLFPHLRDQGYRPIPARPLATGKWAGTWRFCTVRPKEPDQWRRCWSGNYALSHCGYDRF